MPTRIERWLDPAVVWRLCLSGMIATCLIAAVWPSPICSMRIYKAGFILRGSASRDLDAVVDAIELHLDHRGARLGGRTGIKAWWERSTPGLTELVDVSTESGPAHVHLVLYGTTLKRREFRQKRDALVRALRTAVGKNRVVVAD